jgi:hypothetical protein
MKTLTGKKLVVDNGQRVYNWHKNYKQVQLNFFGNNVGLRREKSINDFLAFNAPKPVYVIKDNQTFTDVNFETTDVYDYAKTVLITDQKFSRLPCKEIIRQLNQHLLYRNVLVCLNRTYINIDNSYQDVSLSNDYQTAIQEWLTKHINGHVLNLSQRYFENGSYFTWVVPDQIFWITR